MSRSHQSVRGVLLTLGSAAMFSLGFAMLLPQHVRAQGAAESAAPAKSSTKSGTTSAPKSDAKTPAPPPEKGVKENVKQLGRETTDPGTLQRIKAHEQEFEKKVERKRDRQRKDHGEARPSDAVDLAKNIDKPDTAEAPVKPAPKAAAKSKAETTPAPAR